MQGRQDAPGKDAAKMRLELLVGYPASFDDAAPAGPADEVHLCKPTGHRLVLNCCLHRTHNDRLNAGD